MSTLPLENLELRALQERNRLHDRANEVKNKIRATRQKLDLSRNAGEHFTGMAILASAVGLISGYFAVGLFTDDPRRARRRR